MRRHLGAIAVIVAAAVATGCTSEDATPARSNPPTSAPPADAAVTVTHPGPGATRTGALTPLNPVTPVSVDKTTADLYSQISTVLRLAQVEVHSLEKSAGLQQSSNWPIGPDSFPAPDWARFFDDQAAIVHETARGLREIAPSTSDPATFASLIGPWEAIAGRFEDLADAARLPDGGEQYAKVMRNRPLAVTVTTVQPNSDSLRRYLVALPGYRGPYVVFFGPDAGPH